MGEWALPPDESLVFTALLKEAKAKERPEARWLRGAFWRNFQIKYREINDLHKQMLRTSDEVEAMAAGPDRDRALDHLYRGQSNDCYWHGLFGGIYIGHMRLATYEHLIAAEDLADAAAGRLHVAERRDLDLDGHEDVRLAGEGQVVTLDLTEGAGIGSWDVRPVRHALGSVMRRRPEAYHQTLRDHDAKLADDPDVPGSALVSIHEMVLTKEPGLAAMLHYDPYERRSGLVRFLTRGTTPGAWATGQAVELGDAVEGRYELSTLELDRAVVTRDATLVVGGRPAVVRVTKEVVLGGDRGSPTLALTVTAENRSTRRIDAILGVEWTLTMLGGGGNPAAWLEVAGVRGTHDGEGVADSVTTLAQGNDAIGIAVATTVSKPADAWWAPVETISNSEGGFERVYQGSGLLLSWPISLAAGASRTVTIAHAVTTTRDRAVDERTPAREPAETVAPSTAVPAEPSMPGPSAPAVPAT
jgi:hypothetical protein